MALPLTKDLVLEGTEWLLDNFGAALTVAVSGKPYTRAMVCAIACKETGFLWIERSRTLAAEDLLPLMVGDASGDIAGHPRSAFPTNTAAFRAAFGDAFTAMLIDEANKARAIRGLAPAAIVYKGYGLFQYDLQHVKTDRAFFEDRLWHGIGPCLERLNRELDLCFAAGSGPRDAVRRYNGSGAAAMKYADHVLGFAEWCAELT